MPQSVSRGEGQTQADAEAGETQAGDVLAIAEYADHGDQAKHNGGDRADDGEGADDSQEVAGESETAGAHDGPLKGRRLDRLLAFGTSDGLASQIVLNLESRLTVAGERRHNLHS